MAAGTTQLVAGILAALLAGAGGSFLITSSAQRGEDPISSLMPSDHASEHAGHDMASHDAETHDMAAHAGHLPITDFRPIGFDPLTPPSLAHDPPFDLESGTLPTLEEAKQFTKKYSRFIAKGDEGIDKLRAEGYLTGEGTPDSPYVLEDFYVTDELSITSVDRSIIIREGYVAGQLKLNYIGESVYVHHVYADDLRINENVKRDGENTGGLFHDNRFAFVGQIRHFVGEFTKNDVGPRPAGAIAEYVGDAGIGQVSPEVVFNFDGFHAADVHHNRFVGMVDIKLHGHNHGDCFTCPVHDHREGEHMAEHDAANHPIPTNDHGFQTAHSIRYSSLLFRDNTIEVPSGIALRYNDRNHAGDDRTANSEPNERLEDPHVHFQDITIRDNILVGGSLLVDVFNAADDRHALQNHGILRIWDNDVLVRYEAPSMTRATASGIVAGIIVQVSDGLELSVRGNEIAFRETASEPGSALAGAIQGKTELRGIQLLRAETSNLTLADNLVETGRLGVYAESFTDSVYWLLKGNDFRTDEEWRGKDIENAPEEKP